MIKKMSYKDFPVGTIAFQACFKHEVMHNHIAVLLSNCGIVVGLVENKEDTIRHIENGFGTAIALDTNAVENVEQLQHEFDAKSSVFGFLAA